MTDRPRLWRDINVPGNETAALIESQRHVNRAPLCCPDGIERDDVIQPPEVRRSYKLMWVVVGACLIIGGISIARAFAAEHPTARQWIVWDVIADKPWVSPKGYQATATGPTACNLSLHEASKASPDGSRLTCRRIDQRKD